MSCPSDQALSAFLDGALAADAGHLLEAHLDACPDCRTALSHALRGRRERDPAAVPRGAIGASDSSGSDPGVDSHGSDRPDASGGADVGELDVAAAAGAQLGRYRLLEVLGAGGMGVVYAARDPELDRRVAVKVLRDDVGGGAEGDERLRAEAQTLARISHPNVLAVHDVGRVGRRRFLAMELVQGATLRGVLAQRGARLDERERLRLLVGAGRGVAAAHAVGIVHRDIKPDNVLVGADGRPRVADFGLARAELVTPAPSSGVASTAAGTPAYLAPELRDGARATPASDQYALAIMGWEVFFGERPAAAPTAPRGGSRARRRIAAVLQRGLAVDPALRWPSVTAFVDALETAGRGSAQRLALIAALVVALAGLALVAMPRDRDRAAALASACAATAERADALWSDARAAEVREAFSRTGAASASHAAVAVDAGLRRTAAAWGEAAATACRRDPVGFATGAGPVECLERRHAQATALAETFLSADRTVVERAAAAVSSLTAADACLAPGLAPEPPRPAVWLALSRRIEVAAADLKLGRHDAARAAADAVASEAEAAGAPALRSEALCIAGQVESVLGHLDDAWRLLAEAVSSADRAGADLPRARALIELGLLASNERGRTDEATRSLTLARGAVTRLGEPPALVVALEQAESNLASERGDSTTAIALLDHALAVHREAHLSPLLEASLRNDRAGAYLAAGRYDEALAEFEQVGATTAAILGPDHINVGAVESNIIGALYALDRIEEAETHARRAVAIMRVGLGDSPRLASALGNLAVILGERGRLAGSSATTEEALHLIEEALHLTERLLGPEHEQVAVALHNLGTMQRDAGRPDEAAASYRRAIAIYSSALGDDPPSMADTLIPLAELELAAGHPRAALAAAERAQRVRDPDAPANRRDRIARVLARARRAVDR